MWSALLHFFEQSGSYMDGCYFQPQCFVASYAESKTVADEPIIIK